MRNGKKGADRPVCSFFQSKLLLNRSVLLVSGRSQQSADGQGDLLLLLVDRSDLSLNDLALRENVLRLLDAAVSDLRNVDQAVHAGNHLSESAEGHQLNDTNLSGVAHAVLVHEHLPGIHAVVLGAQGDLVLLGVEGDDVHIHGVANLADLGGVLDAAPGQLGDLVMDFTVPV